MTKRRNHTASFKRKVALEALRGELTLPQIADKYSIALSMVGKGKKIAIEGLPKGFAGSDTLPSNQQEIKNRMLKSERLSLKRIL